MKQETTSRFRQTYGIILSISLIVTGLCLIAGCLTIYFGGDHTYSREIVATTFSKFAIPIYLNIALLIGSIILDLFSPAEKKLKKVNKLLPASTSTPKETIIRYSILVVGIVLLIYGFVTGGVLDVLTKAINICTECIGLG